MITLIITIAVIIILSSVVILNVSGPNGIIHKAAMAKEVNDIVTIKEEAEIVKAELMLDEVNLNRIDLIEKIKEHFKGTGQGGRIVVEDGEYAIYVKDDENLTIEVSKNKEGMLFDGEFDLIVEVGSKSKITLTPKIGGIKTYTEYSREILEGKTDEEKAQVYIDGKKYWEEERGREFPYTTFDEYVKAIYGEEDYPQTLEELLLIEKEYAMSHFNNAIDDVLIHERLVKPEGYNLDESEEVIVSEKNGWSDSMDYVGTYSSNLEFFISENREYVFTGEWNGQVVTKTVIIQNITVNTVTDTDIYNYDSETGYITGIKDEYLEKETIRCKVDTYLSTGFTKLVIPSQIDGVTIVGIAQGAFSDIYNIVSVELPDTIVEIADGAFENCSALKDVYISDSVETISSSAFEYTKISQVFIPQSVTTIESYAFSTLENIVVNCEAQSKPDGWNSRWNENSNEVTVNWGQTRE